MTVETKIEKAIRIAAMAINVLDGEIEELDKAQDEEIILDLMYYQAKFEIIRDLLK